ncbi:recombinase family protein [Chryseobacterium cheonjiense]|uniref:Recombinase family protein n=1 Tax=Chryseobacterium cheonjiense TaxID=2728845 RepID=A0A7Y0A9N7_9FLAO|nr:recombinase family protein [Chryseobacterium cheonjiense]NML59257.1 recombinase family protein [Chryseobacterium cheonjiense]
MQAVYLYIRVSTDEQAVKGYSQRSQLDRLVHYCKDHNLIVTKTIFEDYSAKTFNRPEWNKLFAELKLIKNQSSLILFTYWDRFSRNIMDAYKMLERLQNMKVSIQAIEQQIDFSIPESKIMLAMYWATSEVENDKRSRNVRLGMQKARLEGRWINKAPLGYRNKITSDGKKYIALYEPEAYIIREAFTAIVRQNKYCLTEIYKDAVSNGLNCSRSAFYRLVRNPIYCGKIKIPAFEDKPEKIVEGTHERLIPVVLFDQVQRIIKDADLNHPMKLTSKRIVNENLIFRGVLQCPNCGNTLTGSGSQGHTKKYYYYHCMGRCSYRIRADLINLSFLSFLKKNRVVEPFLELANSISKEIYGEEHHDYIQKKEEIKKEMEKLIDRGFNAQKLFSNGNIDYDDYILIRSRCQESLKDNTDKLRQQALKIVAEKHTEKGTDYIINHLGEFYENSDTITKQRIIRLFFPEKVKVIEGNIEKMLSESVKTIFGLTASASKIKEIHGQQTEQAIVEFFKELYFLGYEQNLKNI